VPSFIHASKQRQLDRLPSIKIYHQENVNVIIRYKSSSNIHDKLIDTAIMLIVAWQEAGIMAEEC